MAELLWKHSEAHRNLANAIIKFGENVTVKNTGDGVLIKGDKIQIPYSVADKHLNLSKRSNGENIWRALILSRKGNLLKFDQDIILIADDEEKTDWTSVRMRRSINDLGREWATKLAMSQAELYEKALIAYIQQFED